MKYYIVKADTRDGEYEYSNISTYISKKKATVEEITEFCQEWFGFGEDSYQEVRLRSFNEITKEEYKVLKKYI